MRRNMTRVIHPKNSKEKNPQWTTTTLKPSKITLTNILDTIKRQLQRYKEAQLTFTKQIAFLCLHVLQFICYRRGWKRENIA